MIPSQSPAPNQVYSYNDRALLCVQRRLHVFKEPGFAIVMQIPRMDLSSQTMQVSWKHVMALGRLRLRAVEGGICFGSGLHNPACVFCHGVYTTYVS